MEERGGRTYSKRKSSPPVLLVVSRKVILSPVIGFSTASPPRAMARLLLVYLATSTHPRGLPE